jgi:uncharacterized protein (DUF488 family)
MGATLLTVGHGSLSAAEFTGLLRGAGVELIVDIRRYPGSRTHPHVAREALAGWLPAAGIRYPWEERLGGRRRAPAASPDRWWQVEAFRGYAHHMRGDGFRAAVDDLLDSAAGARTAVLCSESVWWRCHRRLVSDFAVLARSWSVCHLHHDGRLAEHSVAAGARLGPAGDLVYNLDH